MTNDTADAIRSARAALNDAIARRDVEAIGAFLLPDYHVVTARSHKRASRTASMQSWADMFAHDATATYERTPVDIHVNADWGMAEEHGEWSGRLMASDGPMDLTGVYAAKWHLTRDGWLLQAEIFTPLTVTRPA